MEFFDVGGGADWVALCPKENGGDVVLLGEVLGPEGGVFEVDVLTSGAVDLYEGYAGGEVRLVAPVARGLSRVKFRAAPQSVLGVVGASNIECAMRARVRLPLMTQISAEEFSVLEPAADPVSYHFRLLQMAMSRRLDARFAALKATREPVLAEPKALEGAPDEVVDNGA